MLQSKLTGIITNITVKNSVTEHKCFEISPEAYLLKLMCKIGPKTMSATLINPEIRIKNNYINAV